MTPYLHLNLLLRFDRTYSLSHIIKESVKDGDVVLDAGCGLGILSFWAAKAGAQSVLGVDIDDVELAAELAKANGLSGKVEFESMDLEALLDDPRHQGRYDVIFAMIYFNDPRRDKQQARLSMKLKENLLKPGGIFVPGRVEYLCAVCDWPAEDWNSKAQLVDDQITEISRRYGLNFEPLKDDIIGKAYNQHFPPRTPDGRLPLQGALRLTTQERCFDIDYVSGDTVYPESISLLADKGGTANTVVWWQKLFLNDRLIFTNQTISWIDNPQTVLPGDKLTFALDDKWLKRNHLTLKRA